YYKHPEAKGPFYTSGTTGKPKEIWLNPDDEKWFVPQIIRAYEVRLKKDHRVLSCLPNPPATSGYMVHRSLLNSGYNFLHLSPQELRENPRNFVENLKKFKPNMLTSLTTFAYRLPLILSNFEIEPSFEFIVIGGEPSAIERRKKIGQENNGEVYDVYASAEGGIMAYEAQPFSDIHRVSLPETLMFLTRESVGVEEDEIGDIIISNLQPPKTEPYFIILNYKIGDWAKCVEKEDNGIVTSISEIRREAASLAGAKLNPQEVEKCIEELTELKEKLSGEYCIINYYDNERKAVGEIRVESKKSLPIEEKKMISEKLRERIYSINIPVKTLVEVMKDAKLLIEITNPGELYKGYEQYIKPGKPKRLLVLTDA
ncbi:MAG: AMP-binding protein, partial [Candidatus Aenigmatarchaeota archaeon]